MPSLKTKAGQELAILKRRLPRRSADYFIELIFLVMAIGFGVLTIYQWDFQPDGKLNMEEHSSQVGYVFLLLAIPALFGLEASLKMRFVAHTAPSAEKVLILENVTREKKFIGFEEAAGFWGFTRSTMWLTSYWVTVLYDEAGFYINARSQDGLNAIKFMGQNQDVVNDFVAAVGRQAERVINPHDYNT